MKHIPEFKYKRGDKVELVTGSIATVMDAEIYDNEEDYLCDTDDDTEMPDNPGHTRGWIRDNRIKGRVK